MSTTSLYIKKSFLLVVQLLLLLGCNNGTRNPQLDEIEKAQITRAVETAVWAFHEADTARNSDRVIALLWPDCTMLIDGHRIDYQDISKASRTFMEGISEFHTEWSDLEIIPVSRDAAISSFIFRDSIIDKSGNLTYNHGPNTFLWQKRNGEWRVLFADADHYTLNPGN